MSPAAFLAMGGFQRLMEHAAIVSYTIDEDESPTTAVVRAVARAKGCDELTLDPPLATVIDPDALEQLFARTSMLNGENITLTFRYVDHEVTITGDGTVDVVPVPVSE